VATHTAAQIAHWLVGVQAMVNAKVWDPSKATYEVDISHSGIGLHQKESKQPTFDNKIRDVLIVFSVCVHSSPLLSSM
jgi:hypothetical protein